MRAFFAALKAAIAQVLRMTWKATTVAGRTIWSLVPSFGTPAEPDPAAVAMAAAQEEPEIESAPQITESFDGIRKAAVAMAAGSVTAEHLVGLRPEVVEWLRVMPRAMLCRVACASDRQLEWHLRGRSIRGVLTYDREAVAEYRAAEKRKARRVVEPRAMFG